MNAVDSSVVSSAEVAFEVIFDGAPEAVVARIDAIGASMHSTVNQAESEEPSSNGTGEAAMVAAATLPLPQLLSYSSSLDDAEKEEEQDTKTKKKSASFETKMITYIHIYGYYAAYIFLPFNNTSKRSKFRIVPSFRRQLKQSFVNSKFESRGTCCSLVAPCVRRRGIWSKS